MAVAENRPFNREMDESLTQTTIRSFVYSGTISFICSGLNVGVGLFNGAINAVSTLIDMVIRPILNQLMELFGATHGSLIYRLVNIVLILGFQIGFNTVIFPEMKLNVLATLTTMAALHLFTVPGALEPQLSNLYTFLYFV